MSTRPPRIAKESSQPRTRFRRPSQVRPELPAAPILDLQRSAGNRAVATLVSAAEQRPRDDVRRRALSGRLADGEVKPRRVPRADLSARELDLVRAAAARAGDRASVPIPTKLGDGRASLADEGVTVPGLEVADGASAGELVGALMRAEVKEADVVASGSHYALRLRENPWYEALTGKELDPQPEEKGTEGEERRFGDVTARWSDRPRRERREPERYSAEKEAARERQERERDDRERDEKLRRKLERRERLQEQAREAPAAAASSLDELVTRAHGTGREPRRRNQAVTSVLLPATRGSLELAPRDERSSHRRLGFRTPIVSEQRRAGPTEETFDAEFARRQWPSAQYLPSASSGEHAEPRAQEQLLFNIAQALEEERSEDMPLFALQGTSRPLCPECVTFPEELGLQGMIFGDEQRRLPESTPRWEYPSGIPADFADESELESEGLPGAESPERAPSPVPAPALSEARSPAPLPAPEPPSREDVVEGLVARAAAELLRRRASPVGSESYLTSLRQELEAQEIRDPEARWRLVEEDLGRHFPDR